MGAARILPAQEPPKADITLRIAPVTVELAPDRVISTIGYNDTSPGPVLRMREGVPVVVDVVNDTDVPEQVHWHGLLIPAELDGADEEGTPPVPPHGRRRYQFTPRPAGTRWYHTHTMAMTDLHRGSYTGQFGFLMVDSAKDPGAYDQEVFLALRDWEPFFTTMLVDTDEQNQKWPQPERPAIGHRLAVRPERGVPLLRNVRFTIWLPTALDGRARVPAGRQTHTGGFLT